MRRFTDGLPGGGRRTDRHADGHAHRNAPFPHRGRSNNARKKFGDRATLDHLRELIGTALHNVTGTLSRRKHLLVFLYFLKLALKQLD